MPEDEHSTADSMTLRTALRTSSNRAAVQLLNTVGIKSAVGVRRDDECRNAAERALAGARRRATSRCSSLTRGIRRVRRQGHGAQPILIRRVEDSDGKVLYPGRGKSHRAVSEATAFLMSSMLADVINAGTAYRARQAGFMLPAAGKTGTTNDYVDAWFVGFTPHLVTGVWIGFDQPATIIRNGYAGELAVPIWATFMKVATKGDKPDWLTVPANIVGVNVCRVSGKLPNGGCDSVEVVNRDGVTRNAVDDLHRVLRQGDAADRRCVRCIRRRHSWTARRAVWSRRSRQAGTRRTGGVTARADRYRRRAPPARRTRPMPSQRGSSDKAEEAPEKARLLGAGVREGREDDKTGQTGREAREEETEGVIRMTVIPSCRSVTSPGTRICST